MSHGPFIDRFTFMMVARVIRARHNLKIFESIIQPIAIFMVDNLTLVKTMAKMLLHNPSMVINLRSVFFSSSGETHSKISSTYIWIRLPSLYGFAGIAAFTFTVWFRAFWTFIHVQPLCSRAT